MHQLATKLYKAIWIYGNYFILRKTPVIIFAPGRVGSMALHKNLRDAGVFVFKVEFYENDPRGSARFITNYIFKKKRPAKIITIIRDPISMMATYFFSKAAKGHLPEAHAAWLAGDTHKLNKLFIRDVLTSDRLDKHLYWYERDFKAATGIDIFAHPFSAEARTGVIDHQTYPTLILRTEMDDRIKAKAITEFLNVPDIIITQENSRTNKDDGKIFEIFKENLSLPQEIIKRIYTSKLCEHFLYSNELKSPPIKHTNQTT
jgi:hypothetical protein